MVKFPFITSIITAISLLVTGINSSIRPCREYTEKWILATPTNLQCTSGTFQYKYQQTADKYYLSPQTTHLWSWTTYNQVTGTYQYTSDGGNNFNGFACNGGENIGSPAYGIGCSTAGGNSDKVLPAYWSNPHDGKAKICQDQPAIFGTACQDSIDIYFRVLTAPDTICSYYTECDGEWMLASPQNLIPGDHLFQYKYQQTATKYYLSPKTTALWSWTTYNEAFGAYQYTTDGRNFGTFTCVGGENIGAAAYGIGCSTGGGPQFKVLPAYSSNANSGKANICQDEPGIFGGACQDNIDIYYRTCSHVCCGGWVSRYWSDTLQDHRYVRSYLKPPECPQCTNYEQGDYHLEDPCHAFYFCDIGGNGFPNMLGNSDGDMFEMWSEQLTDHVYVPWEDTPPFIQYWGYNGLSLTGAHETDPDDVSRYAFLFHCFSQVDYLYPEPFMPLYRLWSLEKTDHFYTYSDAERDEYVNNRGYQYEFGEPVCWIRKGSIDSENHQSQVYIDYKVKITEASEMVKYGTYLIIVLLFINFICWAIYWFKNKNNQQYKVLSMDSSTDVE